MNIFLFVVALLLLIGFPIFLFYAIANGIDNKYADYDTKMFLEGSHLPTVTSKEDEVNVL